MNEEIEDVQEVEECNILSPRHVGLILLVLGFLSGLAGGNATSENGMMFIAIVLGIVSLLFLVEGYD